MERNENGLFISRDGGSGGIPREGCGNGSSGSAGDGTQNSGCGCQGMGHRQLAMVYAPMQCFRMLYSPEDALMRGTLFEELDKPLGEALR